MGRAAKQTTLWQYAKPFIVGCAVGAAFALAGVGLAALLVALRAVSSDNIAAGAACGAGGSFLGMIAGSVAAVRVVDREP